MTDYREALTGGEQVYRELKTLASTLVRAIKDESVPDAELLLTKHLIDMRTTAQNEVFEQIHIGHLSQQVDLGAEPDAPDDTVVEDPNR